MSSKVSRFLLFVCLYSITYSCKKDPIIYPVDITGKWKWIKTLLVLPSEPQTPENTGIHEFLVFNQDRTWYKTENGIKSDSGTYTLGHGCYTPYPGAYIFIYDSIAYSRDGHPLNEGDYYKISNDTLRFCPYFGGRYYSYSIPNNGTKLWIKQN